MRLRLRRRSRHQRGHVHGLRDREIRPGWVCTWCGAQDSVHDVSQARAALAQHQAEECPARKVHVSSLNGHWYWRHPACGGALCADWDDALDRAWLHVRSHDPHLSDEQAAQYACAAREGRHGWIPQR